MTWHTPTTEDPLRREAVDLATDATALLISGKDALRPEVAYSLAMECVRVADRIQKARMAALPHEAAEFFGEARLAAVRALVGLDRARAHAPLPEEAAESVHRRLHEMALALGALARDQAD